MLEELNAGQIADWEAYDEVEPFGTGTIREALGTLCAVVANFGYKQVKEKEGSNKIKVFELRDFLHFPLLPKKKKQQTRKMSQDEIIAAAMSLAGTAKANDKKGKKND